MVPTVRSLALDLRAGGLHCEGIDLIMAKDDAPAQGRWGGFSVSAGTELSLTDCTVTIEGDEVRSVALVAQAPAPAPARPRFRASHARLIAERTDRVPNRLPPACS